MTDLLDEISHDLKNEKYDRFVYKLMRIFLTLVVITLIGVAIYVWKENTSEKLQKELSVLFNRALFSSENGKLDESIQYFNQVIEHPSQDYAGLAYLNKASILIKQNKFDQAQETLLEVNKNMNIDIAIRELAEITFLSNQIAFNKISDENLNKELIEKLTKEDRPWKLLALQLDALLKIKQNNIADAISSLEKVKNSPEANRNTKDINSAILTSLNGKAKND